jgi:hypothetical protein
MPECLLDQRSTKRWEDGGDAAGSVPRTVRHRRRESRCRALQCGSKRQASEAQPRRSVPGIATRKKASSRGSSKRRSPSRPGARKRRSPGSLRRRCRSFPEPPRTSAPAPAEQWSEAIRWLIGFDASVKYIVSALHKNVNHLVSLRPFSPGVSSAGRPGYRRAATPEKGCRYLFSGNRDRLCR